MGSIKVSVAHYRIIIDRSYYSIKYNNILILNNQQELIIYMKSIKVRIENSSAANAIVNIMNGFRDCNIDCVHGRYIIDAKSILGVLSMGLPCEVDFVLNSDDPQRQQEFEWGLEPWKAKKQ